MYLLDFEDDIFSQNISSILRQKSFPVTSNRKEKYFDSISIKLISNGLKIFKSNDSQLINLPATSLMICNTIKKLLSKTSINFSEYEYKPINQVIFYKNAPCYLGVIHNMIFGNLLLHKSEGIKKMDLYQLIWPNDKNIQINKLDTHITNLKNKLKNDISLVVNISSSSGIIKLSVN